VRYCITRHVGFLLGFGRSAGDLVRAQQNRRRKRDTDQLRGLQIRHELESRRPLRRQN
jgi:hypothetical protein